MMMGGIQDISILCKKKIQENFKEQKFIDYKYMLHINFETNILF